MRSSGCTSGSAFPSSTASWATQTQAGRERLGAAVPGGTRPASSRPESRRRPQGVAGIGNGEVSRQTVEELQQLPEWPLLLSADVLDGGSGRRVLLRRVPGAHVDDPATMPAERLRVLCVIPTWNRKAALLRCLGRVLAQVRVPPEVARDVLVVDNASTDGSREAVTERFPSVSIVNTGANLGGAGAFRLGLQHAMNRGYDYVWLLDNDAYPSRRILQRYVDAVRRFGPDVLVGGTMHMAEAPRVIHEAGGLFGRTEGRGIELPLHGRRSGLFLRRDRYPTGVDYVAFANAFFPVDVVRRIGLPEDLFLHYDDVEYGLRAGQAGYRVLNVPDAVFWHESGLAKPTTWIQYYDTRNSLHAVERSFPDRIGRVRRRLLWSAAKQVLAGRSALAQLTVQGIRDQAKGVKGHVPLSPRGFRVYDVRCTDLDQLLAAYRCRHLLLDWDSLADLPTPYRHAWCAFLRRDAHRVRVCLDSRRGWVVLDQGPPADGAEWPALGPQGDARGRQKRAIFRGALYLSSRERSGVLTRIRSFRCRARLSLHGPFAIDYGRADPVTWAHTLLSWVWCWVSVRWW